MAIRPLALAALSVPALFAQAPAAFESRTDIPFRLPKPTRWQMPRPLCNIIMHLQPYIYVERHGNYLFSPEFYEFRDTYKNIYEDREELMLWVEYLLKGIIDEPALIKTRRNECIPMLEYLEKLKTKPAGSPD